MPAEVLTAGYGTLVMLLVVMAVSVWLGTQAQKAVETGGFIKGYFLGNRGLGAWAMALTATVQSGGTFMGFPSLVYTHGWIVALWIASYMVVPITGFAVLGKRFAQLSRRTGAITVPDLFDARYGDQRVGLLASLAIMSFMTFLMIAQFKAGAMVMKLAWPGSGQLALAERHGGRRHRQAATIWAGRVLADRGGLHADRRVSGRGLDRSVSKRADADRRRAVVSGWSCRWPARQAWSSRRLMPWPPPAPTMPSGPGCPQPTGMAVSAAGRGDLVFLHLADRRHGHRRPAWSA